MRKYFVRYYGFSNVYDVAYTETKEEEKEAVSTGWERIRRKMAEGLCKAEVDRQAYDSAFAGYAPTVILPLHYPAEKRDWRNDPGMVLHRYIAERRK